MPLKMMMQYDLQLIYEMYESVTTLLYYHCASTLFTLSLSSSSSSLHSLPHSLTI